MVLTEWVNRNPESFRRMVFVAGADGSSNLDARDAKDGIYLQFTLWSCKVT